jgi:hypothetical protein
MLTVEPGPAQVRAGEELVAGRRVAGRLLPYGPGPFRQTRFDPVGRRLVPGRADATIASGPPEPGPWSDALSRVPAGPVVVGPGCGVEPVRGSMRGAALAALESGRPVYLLDPDRACIPDGAADAAVALCPWRPEGVGERGAFPSLAAAADAGITAAAVLPLIPAWTAGPDAWRELVEAAIASGAAAVVPVLPDLGGESRRAIVEARARVDEGEGADAFFEAIHHGDWSARLAEALENARALAASRGVSTISPRPRGRRQARASWTAASRLEELAELERRGEHEASLLHAAVRWIDESGRDLGAIAREGNFRRIFPWRGAVADEAEAALLEEASR